MCRNPSERIEQVHVFFHDRFRYGIREKTTPLGVPNTTKAFSSYLYMLPDWSEKPKISYASQWAASKRQSKDCFRKSDQCLSPESCRRNVNRGHHQHLPYRGVLDFRKRWFRAATLLRPRWISRVTPHVGEGLNTSSISTRSSAKSTPSFEVNVSDRRDPRAPL